ncbi:MAG: hypothetical protein WC708_02015 [Lentisphaeria bacterium]
MAVCLRHPERTATTHCVSCFKPMCAGCVIRRGREVFCSTRCRDDHVQRTGQNGIVLRHEREGRRMRGLVTAGLIVAATVVVAVILWMVHG